MINKLSTPFSLMLGLYALLTIAQVSGKKLADHTFGHEPISFKPRKRSEKRVSTMAATSTIVQANQDNTPANLEKLNQPIDISVYGSYRDVFEKMAFPEKSYTRIQGLDETALFATSVSLSNEFAVIGSNGYSKFSSSILSIWFWRISLLRYLHGYRPYLHSHIIIGVGWIYEPTVSRRSQHQLRPQRRSPQWLFNCRC